jgi:hypothetical protein
MTVSSLTQRIGSRTVIGLLLSTVVLTSSPIRLLSDEALVEPYPGHHGRPSSPLTAYSIAFGESDGLCTQVLDENTLSCGGLQGPGLVIDGCVYSCHPNSRMFWRGRGHRGVNSKCIGSDPYLGTLDRRLTLTYDSPVRNVRFTLCAFNGYPDVAQIAVLNSIGVQIQNLGPLQLPDADPIAIEIHGDDIRTIHIQGSRHSWSPMLDNHSFGDGPSLTAVGTCPGPMTFTVEGGSGTYALAYGATGTTILTGRCTGTVLNLSSPLRLGIITGPVSVNLPAAACGRRLQAVDVADCAVSNPLQL